MSRWFAAAGLLLAAGCTIPPKDPFVAAERAVRRDDLLRALQAYDAVPVAHPRYPDARAAAGDLEQRMRRCHELILQALMLRGEWRDEEALEALRRACDHWPNQPSLAQWIAATEQRLRLFEDRSAVPTKSLQDPSTPATPLFEVAPQRARASAAAVEGENEVAIEIPSAHVPEPLLPRSAAAETRGSDRGARPGSPAGGLEHRQPDGPSASAGERELAMTKISRQQNKSESRLRSSARTEVVPAPRGAHVGNQPAGQRPDGLAGASGSEPGSRRTGAGNAASSGQRKRPLSPSASSPRRLSNGEDPVALGLVSVEARLGRGELPAAVRDLIELARRFPSDARVNLRLGRLLHQRALMHYGQGSVAAAIADWRRVLNIEPENQAVRDLLERALRESGAHAGRDKSGQD